MWIRSDLKARAKDSLRGGYWMAFAICLVVNGISSAASGVATQVEQFIVTIQILISGADMERITPMQEFLMLLPGMLVGFILLTLVSLCLTSPLGVGQYRFFMDARAGRREFNNVMFGFTGNFKNIVKTMFFLQLKVYLWSLLLVIPGIIKSYEYFFVPFLLSENPNMSTKRAFEISKQMSNGEKMNIWVMQLSFVGWTLLGLLACFIGIMFVLPYYYASFAELYAAMRDKAFHFGYATADELPGFGRPYQR